ncbi:MAG: tRNA adenosine(34) deaminase TadA [Candidatus Dasytiphilus stammeri]
MGENEYWMKYALKLANYALQLGEVPVGAIVVRSNEIISEGWNCSINNNDPTGHAEILALRRAGRVLKNYRLLNTTLYVTLEPCVMCIGAIVHSRIKHLVFGARDDTFGISRFLLIKKNVFFNHQVQVTGDILNVDCSNLLKNFFQHRRRHNKP